MDIFCVKYRPSDADVRADTWKDEPITEDLFGPFTEPAVELRVTGRVIPATLQGVRSPNNPLKRVRPLEFPCSGRNGCSHGRSTTHSSKSPDPHASQPEDKPAIAELDRPLPEPDMRNLPRKTRSISQTPYYYIPWRDGSRWDDLRVSREISNSYYMLLQLVDLEFARYRRIGIFCCGSQRQDRYMNWNVPAYEKEVKSCHYDEATGNHTVYIV